MMLEALVVVTGEDGKTRLTREELEMYPVADAAPGGVFQATPLGPNDVALVRFDPGFVTEFHNTPAPTWMFVLTGRIELGLSDGFTTILEPGVLIRMTDDTGEGHMSRVLGDEPVLMATAGYGG